MGPTGCASLGTADLHTDKTHKTHDSHSKPQDPFREEPGEGWTTSSPPSSSSSGRLNNLIDDKKVRDNISFYRGLPPPAELMTIRHARFARPETTTAGLRPKDSESSRTRRASFCALDFCDLNKYEQVVRGGQRIIGDVQATPGTYVKGAG